MEASFLLFAIAAVVAPGPDSVLVMARSSLGVTEGLKTVAGVTAGLLTHTAAATLGVSLAIAALPALGTAFQVVGGGYLIYCGASLLRQIATLDPVIPSDVGQGNPSRPQSFRSGYVTNLSNPKTLVVFTTTIPALVGAEPADPWSGSVLLAGLTLSFMAGTWYTVIAVVSTRLLDSLRPCGIRTAQLLSAGVMAGLGAAVLVSGLHRLAP